MKGKKILAGSLAAVLVIIIAVFYPLADYEMKACVLYSGEGEGYKAAYSQLQHSLMASMSVKALKYDNSNLNKYNIIYPDESIINNPELKQALVNYVSKGGTLFLTNGFLNYFDKEFLGVSEIIKIDSFPETIIFPQNNVQELQEVISDYHSLYKEYKDIEALKECDYGYGARLSTALSIADSSDSVSLYGINKYNKGRVIWTNRLLPNAFHINSADMKKIDDKHYVNTDTTANMLIMSKAAALVSKEMHGHAIERVIGPFGRPVAAWQLHYEEITGFENDSAILFSEICRQYNQIPSFTLIRNSYKWFSRYESINYILNDNGKYNIDFNEGAYSAGKHVIENDNYLKINEFEDRGSYFVDYPEFTERAFQRTGDYNNDNIADIIAGSSDGYIYFYKGVNSTGWKVENAHIIKNAEQKPIKVPGYSAPEFLDVNNDGILDIISGCEDGNIYWFSGNGDFTFEEKGILVQTEITFSMPSAGADMDIIIGSKEGILGSYNLKNHTYTALEIKLDGFCAPYVYDINDDGKNDIIIGTKDGYIDTYLGDGSYNFTHNGYLEAEEMNYKGNNYIKFGSNCVPSFYDVNLDGKQDLIAGLLEYGLAIPIDSPYFKLKDTLKKQIDYIKDNNFYLGVHFYTNEYASSEREKQELELHKKAFLEYGIEWENTGANQHTWYISDNTFKQQNNAGLLWNSGFRSQNSPASPEATTETTLSSTYFMDFDKKDMLVFNTVPLLGSYPETVDITAKYNLPVSIYHHCDFTYENYEFEKQQVEYVSGFLDRNNYNMIKEDQLVKSAAAAYNGYVKVKKRKNGFSIIPKYTTKDFKLYDETYQNSLGYKISFLNEVNASADALVYRYDKGCIYAGVPKKVNITNTKAVDKGHIASVNLPAEINDNYIKFLDGGYMQVIVEGSDVMVESDGWNIEKTGGKTVISKFGAAETLHMVLQKGKEDE